MRVGDERFLSGDRQEFPTCLGQQVAPMGLQPVAVALGPPVLSMDLGELLRVGLDIEDEEILVRIGTCCTHKASSSGCAALARSSASW